MLATFLPDLGVDNWTMLKGIWGPHVWILAASMILTLILTPLCRAVAMKHRVYDMPDERLKTHQRPIPYLGGIAIFLGWAIPVLIIAFTQTAHPDRVPQQTAEVIRMMGGKVPETWVQRPQMLFWIVGAALLIMVLGLIDDLKGISPKLKIIGQVTAALLLVAGGVLFRAFPKALPPGLGGYALFPPDVWWVLGFCVIAQIVLVVGASNATNLLDGLDGLCSGVTAIISCGFLVLATSLLAWDLYRAPDAIPSHYVNSEIIVLMSFSLLGAVLGFLPYNFSPASRL